MVNKIWGSFIIIGIVVCIITNRIDVLNKEIIYSSSKTLEIIMQILPVMALWLGIINIAEKAGLLLKISNLIYPILKYMFPEIPKNHESFNFISSNIVANMFGLGNAATPFGLKAMKSLQELNQKKDTASRSIITFLVINTSGITIIPTTVISLRMMYKSANPTEIILPCFIVTFLATCSGIIIDRFFAKRW